LKIQSPIFPNDIIIEHSEELAFISNSGLIQSISFIEENGAIISMVINTPRAKKYYLRRTNLTLKTKFFYRDTYLHLPGLSPIS